MIPLALVMRPGFLKEGAYSFVFLNALDKTATKVFKRRDDLGQHFLQKVFDSEVKAYELAAATPALKAITPSFIGLPHVGSIHNQSGADVSDQFVLTMAYQMALIPGCFQKLESLPVEVYEPIQSHFRSAGIKYVKDSSAVTDATGAVVAVIDFATQEYEACW